MYACYECPCDQQTKRKQKRKDSSKSEHFSAQGHWIFRVAFLSPALTVSGNESIWFGYLIILLDAKWNSPLQCVSIPCMVWVKTSSFAITGKEIQVKLMPIRSEMFSCPQDIKGETDC